MKTLHTISLVALFAASSSHADGLSTPAIDGVVAAGTPIELIKDGFQGTEGPIALPDGSVIFTEGQANRVTRISADNTIAPYLENSGGAKGLAINSSGELIAVQTTKPGIAVLSPPFTTCRRQAPQWHSVESR